MSKYDAYLKTIESSLTQLINGEIPELNIAGIQAYGNRPNAKFASGVVLVVDGKPTPSSSINAHVVATAKFLYNLGCRKAVKFNGDTNTLCLLDAYAPRTREASSTTARATVTIKKTVEEEIEALEAELASKKIIRNSVDNGKTGMEYMLSN